MSIIRARVSVCMGPVKNRSLSPRRKGSWETGKFWNGVGRGGRDEMWETSGTGNPSGDGTLSVREFCSTGPNTQRVVRKSGRTPKDLGWVRTLGPTPTGGTVEGFQTVGAGRGTSSLRVGIT